jgi:hypothetical protein
MKTPVRYRGIQHGLWWVVSGHDCRDQPGLLRRFDPQTAADWVRDLDRDDQRELLLQHGHRPELTRATDHEVARVLADLLADGTLRVVQLGGSGRPRDPGSAGSVRDDPDQALLSRMPVTAQAFSFLNERLRLVSARRWALLRAHGDGQYEVLPRDAAWARLDRMLQGWDGIDGAERSALAEARDRLTDDPGAPAQGGLLLLKVVPRLAPLAEQRERPAALTPSQLSGRQPEQDVHWIEIVLLDEDYQPVADEPYELQLPDGAVRTGRLNRQGKAYVADIPTPGTCRVCFPQIDRREWRPM